MSAQLRLLVNGSMMIFFFLNNEVNLIVHDNTVRLCRDSYGDKDAAEVKKFMDDEFHRPSEDEICRAVNKKANEIR